MTLACMQFRAKPDTSETGTSAVDGNAVLITRFLSPFVSQLSNVESLVSIHILVSTQRCKDTFLKMTNVDEFQVACHLQQQKIGWYISLANKVV